MKIVFRAGFFRRIVVPAFLAILLFVVSVFLFIIPTFENNAIEQKKTMLHELTNTAWSILQKYHHDELTGVLTSLQAKEKAVAEIEALRYGSDKKDYFWITDLEPVMIMHPYVHELTGKGLQHYADPDGKKIFIEAAAIARTDGEGFIRYKWQLKDDSARIVPKLSFVKKFPPWDWVIGTGIYLQDVQEEISALTRKLVYILLGISFIISLIIAFIAFQSLKIENQRQAAQALLLESKEKYRSLLESSTEGLLLLIGGQISYSNLFIQNLLQYKPEELTQLSPEDILRSSEPISFSNITKETRFEVGVVRRDGTETEAILTVLPIRFVDKEGLLLTFRDTSDHRPVKDELAGLRARLEGISAYSRLGLFRFALSGKGRIMEYNSNVMSLLGYSDKKEFDRVPLAGILAHQSDVKRLLSSLKAERSVAAQPVEMRRKDGSVTKLILSLAVTRPSGDIPYCDGILEPLSPVSHADDTCMGNTVFAALISLSEQPASSIGRPVVACPAEAPLKDAIEIMHQQQSSSILLMLGPKCIGYIHIRNLLSSFKSNGFDLQASASEYMTAPLPTAPPQASVAEVAALMDARNIPFIVVARPDKQPDCMIEKEYLAGLYVDPGIWLDKLISTSTGTEAFGSIRQRLPALLGPRLFEYGTAHAVSTVLSDYNDRITCRIIQLALKECGPPPVPFAFVSIGSAGRAELAFNSDQDNAIVFAPDPLVPDEDLQAYFVKLASRICQQLGRSGLPLCPGDFMASNPKWCQSLDVWQSYFLEWVNHANPENILNISAFFDLRLVYGDSALFDSLEDFILEALEGKTTFFYLLAQSVSAFRPPLSVFGNIVTGTSGVKAENVDIKNCLAPVTMFARIYALRHRIRSKNSMQRIRALRAIEVLSPLTADEVMFHYNFLMYLRLRQQLQEIERMQPPGNLIEPRKLPEMEQVILRKVFAQMNLYNEKLGAEFMSAFKG